MAKDFLTSDKQKMNFLTRYIVQTIENFLPSKTKRLIVVSAALGFAFRTKTLDDNMIQEVNQKLHLSKTVDEMKFGIWINDIVFSETNLTGLTSYSSQFGVKIENVTDEETWKFSNRLATSIPCCFCYGSLQLMTADIHDAIQLLLKRLGKARHPLLV